jgi:hypothetical protein
VAENAFNAVERISEFCDLPQEAPEVIPDTKPDGWPGKGEVCTMTSAAQVLRTERFRGCAF